LWYRRGGPPPPPAPGPVSAPMLVVLFGLGLLVCLGGLVGLWFVLLFPRPHTGAHYLGFMGV